MSGHYSYYHNIDGRSAYLSGNIGALSDTDLTRLLPKYWTVEADVFEAGPGDICIRMRERLCSLLADSQNIKKRDEIEALEFELEPVQGDLQSAFREVFGSLSKMPAEDEQKIVEEFLRHVRFQIGSVKQLYRIKGGLREDITRVIGEFYTYVVFDILFLEFNEHLLMIVLGSDE